MKYIIKLAIWQITQIRLVFHSTNVIQIIQIHSKQVTPLQVTCFLLSKNN